jgi:hypothetical protein
MKHSLATSILLVTIVTGVLCLPFSRSFAKTYGEFFSHLDNKQHSEEQFQTILNILKMHHPKYTEEEIAALINFAYEKLKKDFPDIAIYEVASGILSVSKEFIRVGTADLKEIVAFYIATYTIDRKYY